MSAGGPDLAARVGARLRARRTQLGGRLADVAAQAGVSVSHLSSIEKGTSVASLPVLARVAHAVGLTMSSLLEDEGRPRLVHGSIDDLPPGATSIAAPRLRLGVAALMAEADQTGVAPIEVDGGQVFVYVRSGTLDVELAAERYRLHAGDSLEARDADGIAWRSPPKSGSVSIWAAIPRRAG